MSTSMIDTSTEAYADYMAVKVNGQKPSERAKERGVSPSTISRNVSNIVRDLDAGAVLDGDGEAPLTGAEKVPTLTEMAQDAHPFGAAILAEREKVTANVKRTESALKAAQERHDAAQDAVSKWDENAAKSGFDYAALVAARDALIAEAQENTDGDDDADGEDE